MSKMASQSIETLPGTAWAIFCILVGCLAMHFLLEDSVLFPDLAAPGQAAVDGSLQLYDEADHKDDLVMPAGHLARISPGQALPPFFSPEKHEKLADTPVLPPPKA